MDITANNRGERCPAINKLRNGVPTGLINFGTSCYINASLQCMFASQPFGQFDEKFSIRGNEINQRLYELFEVMSRHVYGIAVPQHVVNEVIRSGPFSSNREKDATEAIRHILATLDTNSQYNGKLRSCKKTKIHEVGLMI